MRCADMTAAHRILIVEDEPLIAMMLEDFLESLGHEVSGSCDTVAEAAKRVAAGGFDLAILDVNLRDEAVWPVAAQLRDAGLPFVLATGGHVEPPPPEFGSVPLLQKPYTIERVATVIDEALASA